MKAKNQIYHVVKKIIHILEIQRFYLFNKYFRLNKIKIKKFWILFLHKKTALELIKEIFFCKIYFFKTRKKDPFIIDAGANIGISILYFKHLYPLAQVVAFEPEPETFKILKKNIAINNLKYVNLHQTALSNYQGFKKFYRDSSNRNFVGMALNRRLAFKGFPTECTIVQCLKLSKFIHQQVDLLKLDIEGSELQVINELIQSKKIRFIKNIILEFHLDKIPQRPLIGKLVKSLEENRFTVGFSKHLGKPFTENLWSNALIISACRTR